MNVDRNAHLPLLIAMAGCCLFAALPAYARSFQTQHAQTIKAAKVGQRQTREQAAPNVHPAGRINNRLQTRIESRIRSRIEPGSNAQAGATESIIAASNRAQATSSPR